jgi:hypothetical protein
LFWSAKQLFELEHAGGTLIERAYPHGSVQMKLLFAKLTAIIIVFDDSIEDEAMYRQLMGFSRRLYGGKPQ